MNKPVSPVDRSRAAPLDAAAAPELSLSPAQRPGSIAQTFRAVAWSFFGVRRRVDLESDVQRLNPVHVVIAGVISALVFIGVLVLLVKWVVGSGVAA